MVGYYYYYFCFVFFLLPARVHPQFRDVLLFETNWASWINRSEKLVADHLIFPAPVDTPVLVPTQDEPVLSVPVPVPLVAGAPANKPTLLLTYLPPSTGGGDFMGDCDQCSCSFTEAHCKEPSQKSCTVRIEYTNAHTGAPVTYSPFVEDIKAYPVSAVVTDLLRHLAYPSSDAVNQIRWTVTHVDTQHEYHYHHGGPDSVISRLACGDRLILSSYGSRTLGGVPEGKTVRLYQTTCPSRFAFVEASR